MKTRVQITNGIFNGQIGTITGTRTIEETTVYFITFCVGQTAAFYGSEFKIIS